MADAALITGAAGGIGQALCDAFTRAGYRVYATDKLANADTKCDRFDQIDIRKHCLDEGLRESLLARVHSWLDGSGLSVLINNAAVQKLGRAESLSIDDWQQSMDTNVTVPFILSRSLAPELRKSSGCVLNIGSVHVQATKPGFAAYSTSKSALQGLTRALALDFAPDIRVNAINPAATRTPMLVEGFNGDAEKLKILEDLHPLRAIVEPSDVAKFALFITSDAAMRMTGSAFNLDAGILSCLHDPK